MENAKACQGNKCYTIDEPAVVRKYYTTNPSVSVIALQGIRSAMNNYLSHRQSGFRPGRRPSDVVRTIKCIAVKIKISDLEVQVTGIALSAACDTMKRKVFLLILREIVNMLYKQ